MNFDSTSWLGVMIALIKGYGHSIEPQNVIIALIKCLVSPTITINEIESLENAKEDGLYTVIMTDLDRVNLETKSFDEWCHWLVTDIKVSGGRTKIVGGSNIHNPIKPANGNTVLEYAPPHPALSNPSKQHRYVITVLKQNDAFNSDQLLSKITDDLKDSSRAHFLPLRAFMKTYQLEWAGFGFFCSTWNTKTSEIFAKLGK
jgi:large subunit ribosomal protein L35